LPGSPDIAFTRRRKVIFVNGCFWHQHENCIRSRRPEANAAYWNEKLDRNVERDASNIEKLNSLGWSALVVWECEMKSTGLIGRIVSFLGDPKFSPSDANIEPLDGQS
jgi:DNA mismatch endonuclease (patch repair protein)